MSYIKRIIFILLILILGNVTIQAQDPTSDSSDIFYRHVKLGRFTLKGQTSDPKLKEIPTPITTISSKALHQTAATNIVDALTTQPGIEQISTGGGISKPVIRGLGYNRVVTVVDGLRQEGQQWGDEHGLEVDEYGVQSVEIIKGPASLLYGSDAMAGVIVLHPAGVAPLGDIRGDINGEYQSNNGLWGYSAHLQGSQRGWVWDARWSQRKAHEYKNREDGYVPGSQFGDHTVSTMVGRNSDKGYTHLRVSLYETQLGIVEGERDTASGELIGSEEAPSYSLSLPFQHVSHFRAVLDNAYKLWGGKLNATLGYQQNRRQEFEEDEEDYELYFQLHTLTYNLHYTHPLGEGWKLDGGVNGMVQRSLNHGEEYLIPDYSLLDAGIFAIASKSYKRLTVSGGLRGDSRHLHSDILEEEGVVRFEEVERNFEALTGRIGGVYNARKGVSLRANLSRGFRAPNISELRANGVHEGTNRYEVGNANLKAEYSLQGDLGIDIETRHLTAQAALFASRIDNFIFAQRSDIVLEEGTLTYHYQQGTAALKGFELGVDIHPIHSLHIGSTLAYVHARQLHQPDSSRYLPMIPATHWNTDIKWEITHSGKVFNNSFIAAELEHYFAQNHIYSAANTETPTPAYTLINITIGTDIYYRGIKKAEVYLVAKNLTDAVYQNHLSRLKYTDWNNITGKQGVFNMGRNIVLKVNIPLTIKTTNIPN